MEIKEKILIGASDLFYKYGTKSITMDDIAKHLGMSKKTIYQFYDNKNKIVLKMMEENLIENENTLEQITHESENTILEMIAIIDNMRSLLQERSPVIFYDLQKYHKEAWKLFISYKANCEAKVSELLEKGIIEGLVRDDINPKIISRLRIMDIELGFNSEAFPPTEFSIKEVQIAIAEMFLHGICTFKGHQIIEQHKSAIETNK